MYKIKMLNKISNIGIETLDKGKYTVAEDASNPDAILVRSADMHDYSFNPELLCIARAGAGTNNIPSDRCREEGIVVFNTPGANANAVKEIVICALFLASRDILGGIEWVKKLESDIDVSQAVEKGKSAYVGPEISGKTLGVVGLGAIGAKIANAVTSLGMKVYGYDPYLSVDAAWNLSSDIIHATDLETIYKNCDYITLHVPYMEATHHLINESALGMMKNGVRIINIARGELVNDDDMIAAINSGKVARYVTDFPNNKIVNVEGIIAIPHLGASTPESEDNCAVMAAREVIEYIENGNIINSVNMPSASMPRTGDPRLCVIHKNVPDMISQITGAVSACGINIENMLHSAEKNMPYSYMMMDVHSVADGLTETIKAIEGVVRVRVLN